jgi:hypothetical protein
MTLSDKSFKLILSTALFTLAGSIFFASNEANAGTSDSAKIIKLQSSVKALTKQLDAEIYDRKQYTNGLLMRVKGCVVSIRNSHSSATEDIRELTLGRKPSLKIGWLWGDDCSSL